MVQYVEVDNTVKVKKPETEEDKTKKESTQQQSKTVKILME